MYNEKVTIEIGCDRPGCNQVNTFEGASREIVIPQIFESGWRLYRGKQLCPTHARVIARQLMKKLKGD